MSYGRRFRKKPVVIEASQWFKFGDHPEVTAVPESVRQTWTERTTDLFTKDLGWIGTLESGHVVTPGDWIIRGVKGELYPCKPDVFDATYEPAE